MRDLAIVIPAYNDGEDLEKSLESICEDNNDFKVIIIDDGSTIPVAVDAAKYKFQVEIYRLAVNSGITAALNKALEIVKEEKSINFIARLDAGDIQEPHRLAKQYQRLSQDAELTMLGANVSFYDVDGNLMYHSQLPQSDVEIKKKRYIKSCFIHPSVMFKRRVLDDGLMYSTAYPAAEDYELFFRISGKYKVANLAEVLVVCHDRRNGISIRRRQRQVKSVLKTLLDNHNFTAAEWYAGVLKVVLQLVLPREFFSFIKARLK